MSEMRVAIIDNGVATELVDCYHEVDLSERNISEKEKMEKYGHGTICAAIIKKWIMDEDEKTIRECLFLHAKILFYYNFIYKAYLWG